MFTYETVTDNCVALSTQPVNSRFWKSPTSAGISFTLLVPLKGRMSPIGRVGTRAQTSKARNEFGDKDCDHINVKGHALLTTDRRLHCPFGYQRYSTWSQDTYYTGVHFPNNLVDPSYWSQGPNGPYTSGGWNLLVPPHGGTFSFYGDQAGMYRQCRGSVSVEMYATGAVITYNMVYDYASYAVYESLGVISIDWDFPSDPEWWLNSRQTIRVTCKQQGYIRTRYKSTGRMDSKATSNQYSQTLREIGRRFSPGYNYGWFVTQGEEADIFGLLPDYLSRQTQRLRDCADADLQHAGLSEAAPWGDLAYDAVQDMRVLTSNEAANVMDLVELLSLILKPSKFFEKAGEGILDLASAAFLSERYGLENNIRDISEILNANYRKLDFYVRGARLCRASRSLMLPSKRFGFWNCRRGLKAYFRPPMDALTFFAYEAWVYGFSASASTIWDFIPFSFVVDWAVNVGDCFARLDAEHFASKCDTRSVLQTTRSETQIDASILYAGLAGNLNLVVFERHVTRQLPSMPVRLEMTAPSLDHFWEGSALIIQQRR